MKSIRLFCSVCKWVNEKQKNIPDHWRECFPQKRRKQKVEGFSHWRKQRRKFDSKTKRAHFFDYTEIWWKKRQGKKQKEKKKWNCVCVLIAVLVCASAGCRFRHRLWFSDLQTAALLWKCKNTLWPQSSREAIIEGGTNLWRAPGCWTSTENFGIGGSCWFEKKSPSSFKR